MKQRFFEESAVELTDLFSELAEPGYFVIIPSFRIPATKVKFNGKEIETPEIETPETKLHCINNKDGKHYLLFDNCLFCMPMAPFKDETEVCFKNSFLKKYLKKVFLPAFLKAVNYNPEFKIKCDILSKAEVFGESKESDKGILDWFREPKHKIAMYKNTSDWWWLSDCVDASAALFCFVYSNGASNYIGASGADVFVRPRFVIERKA